MFDNHGFSELDRKDNFEAYMQQATEPNGSWDYLNGEHAADAINEYPYKALQADLSIFMRLASRGQYQQACEIISGIVTRHCDAMARQDFSK